MHYPSTQESRRRFVRNAAFCPLLSAPLFGQTKESNEPSVLGPRSGYSPQIGTLVSEMFWMRQAVTAATKGMTPTELDFLLDNKANRIGALILHLAATEKLYQLNTFENVGVKELFDHPDFKDWKVAMALGEPAREAIKGHDLAYYLQLLEKGREKTFAEFRKRDDAWLIAVDKTWPWGPTDNLCKWFHVCEHESHHTGQISLIKGRLPGAKPDNG